MTKELREQMDALRSVAPKLNAASQNAAKVMKQVEDFLAGLHIGVYGEGDVFKETKHREAAESSDTADLRRLTYWSLAYGRMLTGAFCIHVIRDIRGYEEDIYGQDGPSLELETKQETWESLSRGDRLKSFATLPSLLKSIAENAQAAVEEAEAAARAVEESMAELGIDGAADGTAEPPLMVAGQPPIPAIRRRK